MSENIKQVPSKTRFIRVIWCDNANIIRGKAVHTPDLNNEISVGISRAQQGVPVMYDGVVDGSGLDPVGEITLKGDLSTLTNIPYTPGHARVMGDMMKDGKVWRNCPRGFLKRMVSALQDEGLEIKSSFENEFYLLKREELEASDCTPFASTYSMDINHSIITEITEALLAQNIHVEQYYPEAGPGQHEITMRYDSPLPAADNQIIFRETVKALAFKNDYRASFLPNVFPDTAGNGSHLHLSLWKDGENILHDWDGKYGLSTVAQHFMAGIMHHLPSLMAITTPIPRSYQRIKPQMWCGAFRVWGFNNREAALRVIRADDGDIQHFEFKTLDVSANPYLALGAVIAAGLDGIKENMELEEPVQKDPATLSEDLVEPLPNCMGQSLDNLKNNKVLLNALGDDLAKSYLAVKEAEYEALIKLSPKEEIDLLLEKY